MMPRTNLEVVDVRPFIGAQDLQTSRNFYEGLGWSVIFESENLLVMELADHRFNLQNYYEKNWCENTMLHIAVADVSVWFDHVSRVLQDNSFPAAVRMSDEPKDEGYANVFHVWDPAGILLHFAQFKS